MSKDSFDFDAGNICLDFANTNNWHASEHPQESLDTYADMVSFARAAGLFSAQAADQLSRISMENPEVTQPAYQAAIQLREAIYHIFSNRYAGTPLSDEDLSILNTVVKEAMAHRSLVSVGDGLQWQWNMDGADTRLISWTVALAAADLLTSEAVQRVRECEDDRGCGYLFIDMSKNHSRRWCSMESCGNRAKARRHYSKSKPEKV
jgi:predicted RNA-binding Zn ribbon-like protein